MLVEELLQRAEKKLEEKNVDDDTKQEILFSIWKTAKDKELTGRDFTSPSFYVWSKSCVLLPRLKRQNEQYRKAESVETVLFQENLEEIAMERVFAFQAAQKIFFSDDLTQKEKQVLALCFGGSNNQEEIGKILGITRARVNQIFNKAINKARIVLRENMFTREDYYVNF